MSQHRRGSIHGSSPVPGHPSTTVSASSVSSSASHEVQTRGIPLPGMVPSRSIHASPMHGNPIHGFVNPLGPGGLVHPSPPTHAAAASGISHHPNVHQGIGTSAVNGYIIFQRSWRLFYNRRFIEMSYGYGQWSYHTYIHYHIYIGVFFYLYTLTNLKFEIKIFLIYMYLSNVVDIKYPANKK